MILSLDQIGNYEFTVSNIRFYDRQRLSYRQIRQNGRKVNGLIFLRRGECRFTSDDGAFSMQPGTVAYIPYGSRHVFELLSDDTAFFRVDFDIKVDDETVLFSRGPIKLCQSAPAEFYEALHTTITHNCFVQDSLARAEQLCTMLRSLAAVFTAQRQDRLTPALTYLLGHLTEKISCVQLAALCNLSPSRFYYLFQRQYGKTPLAYRDDLLIRRAKLLLQSGNNVGETAEMLGFASTAYFSRFFKKNQGIAPSEYAEWQKGGI